ncbi:MAG: S8 family serine peptidase [Elusimicrobiota bacterium]
MAKSVAAGRGLLFCLLAGALLLCGLPAELFAQHGKLSPRLRTMRRQAAEGRPVTGFGVAADAGTADPIVSLLLRLRPGATREAVVARYPGSHFGVLNGRILTARLRASLLDAIDTDPDVDYAESPARYEPALEIAKSSTTSGSVYLGILDPSSVDFGANKGQGVVIGFVDTGIDWDHYDFRDDVNVLQSRILSIWDQTIASHGGGPNPAGYAYGAEYTQTQINNEIDGLPAGVLQTLDTNGHGSHVAGIAAGDGSDSDGSPAAGTYSGIAPQADIIMVKTSFIPSDILDGVNYIVGKAAAAGKRAVVNLSIQGQSGAHDGTLSFEQGINTVAASTPVVIAMGNYHDKSDHALYTFAPSGIHSFTASRILAASTLEFEFWAATGDAYDLTITDGINTPVSVSNNQDKTSQAMGTASLDIYNGTNSHPGGDKQILITITGTISQSNFTFSFTRVSNGGTGKLHGWNIYTDYANFTSDVDLTSTLTSPSVIANGIGVGSYCSKQTWYDGTNTQQTDACTLGEISSFSGHGPTRDGRQKPDIAAPGHRLASTLSTDSSATSAYTAQDNRHYLRRGTSMAAPVVAGAIAVRIQQNSTLTAAQIKSNLQTDTHTDSMTGASLPDGTWGYGKLKVLACGNTVDSAPSAAVPVTLGASSISWTWGAVTNATSYNIYYATDTGTLIANVASPAYTFTSLAANTDYRLEIRGQNICGEGTGGVSLTTATLTVPVSGSGTFAQEITRVTVGYSKLSGQNEGYLLHASTAADFTGTIFSSSTPNSDLGTLLIEGLSGFTTYYFRIGTLNPQGASVFSTLGSTRTDTTLLAPGTSTFSNISESALRANWTRNGNPSGLQYFAYLSTAADFSGTLLTEQTSGLYADFSSLSANATYYFQVRPATGPFGAASSTATHALAPGAVTPAFTGVYLSSVTAYWTDGGNPSGTWMLVESSTEAGFGTLIDSSSTQNTSRLLTGVWTNTTVYVRVSALNRHGIPTSYLTLSTATMANPPGLVAAPFASVTSSITVRWTPLPTSPSSAACQGYQVEASTSPTFYPIATANRTADAAASSLGVEGLLFQTTYYLRVGAVNLNGVPTFTNLGSSVTVIAILSSSTLNGSELTLSILPSVLQLQYVEVNIPPGTLPDGVSVTVNASVPFDFDSSAVKQVNLTPLGAGVAIDIDAQGNQPLGPVAIRMDYDPAFLPPGVSKHQLVIAHLRDGYWDVLETENDTAGNVLRAQTRHFSLFAPFYVAAGTALDNVQIFPIPWMPGSGDANYDAPKLSIMNLPAGGSVQLYSIIGESLGTWDASAAGMVYWDGKSKRGMEAGSGTYLVVISGAGARRVERVVVIR